MPLELTPKQPPYYEIETGPTPTGPIKIYNAFMQQAGTAAPTAHIIQNSIGNIIWTRADAGAYIGTLENAFPLFKTTILATLLPDGTAITTQAVPEGPDTVKILTIDSTSGPNDNNQWSITITTKTN